jgi:N-sulfoglucosamine sulfohydrolase
VSLIDLAPTFLQLHGITGLAPVTGKSLTDLFAGTPKEDRSFVLIGRERNDVRARPGTPHGLGYPARGIRMGNLLYVRNFEPDRWPCGNPLGFIDTDASPTKTLVNSLGTGNPFWEQSFGKRPSQQLFDLEKDPDCVHNLAAMEGEALARLSSRLETELKRQEDPRILGKGDIFDNYPSTKGAPPVGR